MAAHASYVPLCLALCAWQHIGLWAIHDDENALNGSTAAIYAVVICTPHLVHVVVAE